MRKALLLNEEDNVAKEGEYVIKYGEVIGVATKNIGVGEHVHVHNVKGCFGLHNHLQYSCSLMSKTLNAMRYVDAVCIVPQEHL